MTSSGNQRRRRVAGERRPGQGSGTGRGIPTPPPVDRATPGADEGSGAPVEAGEQAPTDEAGVSLRKPAPEPEATEAPAATAEPTPERTGPTPEPTAPAPTAPVRRPGILLPALAAGLALLLAVLGGLVTLLGRQADDGTGQERTAVNSARTSLEQLLSYNYETIDKQTADVTKLLTGSFKDDYGATVAKDIKPLAVKNKTVVQARVSEAGVMRSTEGTVTVLAFVDQARASAELDQPTIDQNRVIVTMKRVGDRWLIEKLQAF